MPSDAAGAAIRGTLYGSDGSPIAATLIELRDPGTNMVLATTHTHSDGTFELYNMASGRYMLVAQLRGLQASELVSASGMQSQVSLRMKSAAPTAPPGSPEISIARLKVPQKACDRYVKAEQAFSKGNFDGAEKAANDSLAIYPQNPEALTLRGLLALRHQNTQAAIEDFQRSIELDPSYAVAYTAMGSVFNSEGKFDEAARVADRAVTLNPTAWQGYFEVARSFMGRGMYEKALQFAERAEALGASGFATVHLLKAYAMVPLKRYKEADTELQAFLSHPPQGQDTSSVKQLLSQVQEAEAVSSLPARGSAAGMAFVTH
jgi:tetratricopeptide (TPR) repeat protein